MNSVATLPDDVRTTIISFMSASSRLSAVNSHSWVFAGSGAEKPVEVVRKQAKRIREILAPLCAHEAVYPLITVEAKMTYVLADGSEENLVRDAPFMFGLSRSDVDSEIPITSWMRGTSGERFTCPFEGWLSLNNNDASVTMARDMFVNMNGTMRFFTDKACVVMTFADPGSGIEGYCGAAGPFIDSDEESDQEFTDDSSSD